MLSILRPCVQGRCPSQIWGRYCHWERPIHYHQGTKLMRLNSFNKKVWTFMWLPWSKVPVQEGPSLLLYWAAFPSYTSLIVAIIHPQTPRFCLHALVRGWKSISFWGGPPSKPTQPPSLFKLPQPSIKWDAARGCIRFRFGLSFRRPVESFQPCRRPVKKRKKTKP